MEGDWSELEEERRKKLARLRERGADPYPSRWRRSHTAADARVSFREGIEGESLRVAGRMMSLRAMGRASFAHIADGSGRIQIYLREDLLGKEAYRNFLQDFDIGDFIGVEGRLFRTRTGETTIAVEGYAMLAKSLRTLPEKWHGLRDVETRYRQRYLDLIANPQVRETFLVRTRLVAAMRRYLDGHGFLEVETPILQPVYGGAAARPFTTYHNELEQSLYLRISFELYLKRLIIGGLDKVYEIGKDFRNEGISTKHNPEFTQMELYVAYADYNDIMALVEEMVSHLAQEVLGRQEIAYQGNRIDLKPPWRRVTLQEAIREAVGIDILAHPEPASLAARLEEAGLPVEAQPTWGKLVDELFSTYVEPKLVSPTFVLDYPVEISPLAKRKPGDRRLVERFEFFIGGVELGNAFSELNDPLDQRERFISQAESRAAGDEEAHPMDEEYLLALEYGMPPTGGLGIGMDRLVMLLTDQRSIREVIVFPHLRTT